jgi:hypothetical protein
LANRIETIKDEDFVLIFFLIKRHLQLVNISRIKEKDTYVFFNLLYRSNMMTSFERMLKAAGYSDKQIEAEKLALLQEVADQAEGGDGITRTAETELEEKKSE